MLTLGKIRRYNSKLKTQNFYDRARVSFSRVVGKPANGAPEQRVCPLRRHLGRRREGEHALVQPWVGEDKLPAAAHDPLGEKEIDIQSPRSPAPLARPVAAGLLFETVTGREQGG